MSDIEDYIRKYNSMKPSELIEELCGIKLFEYQKIMVDTLDKFPKPYLFVLHRNNIWDDEYIQMVIDSLCPKE